MDVALSQTSKKHLQSAAYTRSIKPVLRGVWFDPSELVIDDLENGGRIDVEQAVLGAHSILYFVNKDQTMRRKSY